MTLGVACLSPSEVDDPPIGVENRAPIAVANPSSAYPLGSSVTLSGLDSFDPDGDSLAYHWTVKIPGVAEPIENTEPEFVLEILEFGQYRIELSVEDPDGASSSTIVLFSVIIPVAEIEANGEVEIFQRVDIRGKIDSFGANETSFSWRFLRRPPRSTAQLADTDTLEPSFVADRVGKYIVELRADSALSTSETQISVIAKASQFATNHRIVDFDYSPELDKWAGTSRNSNRLLIVNPSSWSELVVGLNSPKAVAFTLDGTQLVVGYRDSQEAILQIDPVSGSIYNLIPIAFAGDFRPTINNQILSTSLTGAKTLNLTSLAVSLISGPLGANLLAANNSGNKFYTWENNNRRSIGRLTVSPLSLGSHQLAADDCSPLWSSLSEQFVVTACGKILRVSDDETLDLAELGTLSVPSIETAVHAPTLGLIIVATDEGDEFALRAFDDVTFAEQWVRALPDWQTDFSDGSVRGITPRALYMLPDGQSLFIVGQWGDSLLSQYYLLRFRL